jgi:glycosyltransferase involved in cell wall biosynthesis
VVGCSPEIPHDLLGVVKTVGFLKKDHPDDMRLMHSIFIRSHALILLSQAECYGCVYCEANAYGLPALGRDTGGVSEIIRDGVNGLLLQDEESIESYAQRWAGIWGVEFSFRELSKNSYLESEQRLNYSVFAEKLEDVLSTVVTEGNLKSNQR